MVIFCVSRDCRCGDCGVCNMSRACPHLLACDVATRGGNTLCNRTTRGQPAGDVLPPPAVLEFGRILTLLKLKLCCGLHSMQHNNSGRSSCTIFQSILHVIVLNRR